MQTKTGCPAFTLFARRRSSVSFFPKSGGCEGTVCGDSSVSVSRTWRPSGGSVAPASVSSFVSRKCATA